MLIFGNGEFAKVMYPHFGCRLTVHREYIKEYELAFEDAEPQELVIAVGHKNRKSIYNAAIERGFSPRGYFGATSHRQGLAWHNSIILEHNFIQHYAYVGKNNVLWSFCHVGHHSQIGDHNFITSHVCIGGGAVIGNECFIGMNATVFDHVKIGNNCIIAAGAVVDRDIPDNHTLSRKGVLVANA